VKTRPLRKKGGLERREKKKPNEKMDRRTTKIKKGGGKISKKREGSIEGERE